MKKHNREMQAEACRLAHQCMRTIRRQEPAATKPACVARQRYNTTICSTNATNAILRPTCLHVRSNWITLPPQPAKASTITHASTPTARTLSAEAAAASRNRACFDVARQPQQHSNAQGPPAFYPHPASRSHLPHLLACACKLYGVASAARKRVHHHVKMCKDGSSTGRLKHDSTPTANCSHHQLDNSAQLINSTAICSTCLPNCSML
jgi:hypothetical protein